MTTPRSALGPLVVICCTLFACKLLKPSPKKLCEKAMKFAEAEESEGKSPESSETKMAGCVASLEKMKSDEPERYECTTKCVGDAKDSASFVTCAPDCQGASASASKSDDDDATKTYPVDSLSSSEVRSKISIAYSSYGYDISGEKSNSTGWSATVTLGKKGPSGEVHIYKVLLLDVSGRKDGFKVLDGLGSSKGASESRVGNKKALLVECLYQRSSTETGVPKACGGYDSRITSFTDDIARYQ